MSDILKFWSDWLDYNEIPSCFHNACLENPLEHQREFYRNLCECINKSSNPLIFVKGNIGSGKTHAAIALAKHYHQQRVFPVYCNLPFLSFELQSARYGGSVLKLGDIKKRLKEAAVLIMDDFGLQKQDEFLLELCYEVIDSRANDDQKTMIFTNLTDRGLKDAFTAPLLSRLAFFKLMTLPAKDCRKVSNLS